MKKNRVTGENYDVVESFNYAIDGVFEAIRSERHMKFHGFATVIAVMVSIFSDMNRYEIIALGGAITVVWVAELFNSAVESVVDMVTSEYHPLAKKAKDIAAGAVLISSLYAIFVGYMIFDRKIGFYITGSFNALKDSFQNAVALIVVIIVMVVIVLKYIFKKGRPLRGGIPSGHSALAGAAFMAITFLTINPKIYALSFILLVLVMQSRVEGKIHTLKETLIGATIGMGIMYLFLRIIGF